MKMALEPFDWSVVIVGRWNQAILTPKGIATKLFGIADAKGLEIGVPLDGLSPYRVKHPDKNLFVETESSKILIHIIDPPDYDRFTAAMEVGVRTLKWLPETPVSAAGFNLKFSTDDYDDTMIKLVESNADGPLTDLGNKIIQRTMNRSLEYKMGSLNLIAMINEKGFELSYNFHCGSNKTDDLIKWLETPATEIENMVSNVLTKLELEVEE